MRVLALIACAWVLGAAAPLQQPQQAPEGQQAAAHEAPADQSQTAPMEVRVPASQPVAKRHAPKAEQAEQAEDVELGSWPDWVIVGFTLVLTIVAILQHRLEAKMGKETANALALAKQSADAAVLSATAMRDNVELLKNAYRPHMEATFNTIAHDGIEGEPRGYAIRVQWKNVGGMAAERISLAAVDVYLSPEEYAGLITIPEPPEVISNINVGVGVEYSSLWLPFVSIPTAMSIWRKEKRLIVFSRVTFKSAVEPGERHISDICVEVLFTGDPSSRELAKLGQHGVMMAALPEYVVAAQQGGQGR